jgi:ElaB/YqjD/DUF883 family membrane-anchored ribosome-binding protein
MEQDESEQIENRISFLENEELNIVNRSKLQKQEVDNEFQLISDALQRLKSKAEEVKNELSYLNAQFQSAVLLLRKTVSKSDLDAADKKVSVWGPDKLVTRKEFLKMLKENK